MVVQRRLARNRQVVPGAQLPKAEAWHPPNPSDNFLILVNSLISQCSVAINSDSDSSHNSLNLGSFQDSPDLRAVPHPAHLAKEDMVCTRVRNQDRNHFRPVPAADMDMVDLDRSLELSLDLNPSPVMVMEVKVDQHRLLDPNQSAVVTNMVLTEP